MDLEALRKERSSLIQAKNDNIGLVESEFNPKINAITSQIEGITGKSETKKRKSFIKENKGLMRNAKNMR